MEQFRLPASVGDSRVTLPVANVHKRSWLRANTRGKISSTSRKRIETPDACIGLSVKFMAPLEMQRTSKARFVLPTP